jgi:hypothetical protein
LEEYFLFLTVVTGRGLFYLYVGAIHTSVSWKASTLNVLIGVYMLFVGYMYLKVAPPLPLCSPRGRFDLQLTCMGGF